MCYTCQESDIKEYQTNGEPALDELRATALLMGMTLSIKNGSTAAVLSRADLNSLTNADVQGVINRLRSKLGDAWYDKPKSDAHQALNILKSKLLSMPQIDVTAFGANTKHYPKPSYHTYDPYSAAYDYAASIEMIDFSKPPYSKAPMKYYKAYQEALKLFYYNGDAYELEKIQEVLQSWLEDYKYYTDVDYDLPF